MTGFKLITANQEIRFHFYLDAAPVTSAAFARSLPFVRTFYHARISGREIWIDDVPPLDIIQENASVFAEPGEVVVGPMKPVRAKTANCLGIYYGEGKGLDACNIFARVAEADLQKLTELGNEVWKNGGRELKLELM
ncbi:MAG TPA: DUF3830 family protein [Puia sp.]|jgi:hypothetical protein|nr:DUF3830 family protein [Puia sp.]